MQSENYKKHYLIHVGIQGLKHLKNYCLNINENMHAAQI